MKTVCRYFYYFGKIENSQLHSDQPNIFNKILRGSEEKWKKQWSGPYILKARILTPTILQKRNEFSANLSKNATKWPKNDPKWPKVAQI